MSARYLVSFRREVTITAAALIKAFDREWEDAKARGLDEDGFAQECFRECDFDSLADLSEGAEHDDWEVTAL